MPVPVWVFRANRLTRRVAGPIVVVGRAKNKFLLSFLIKMFLMLKKKEQGKF